MYCSKCGSALEDDRQSCPACGHPAGTPLLQDAADAAERNRFDRLVRRLGQYWLIFAALNFVLGAAGFFLGPMGGAAHARPYEPWPHPLVWNWTLAAGVVWILLASRVVLSIVAAWGLSERFNWSRPVAIFAGAVAITQFPIGLVLGAYTIAMLLGKRRAALYVHRG